jgi:hypothetical protein
MCRYNFALLSWRSGMRSIQNRSRKYFEKYACLPYIYIYIHIHIYYIYMYIIIYYTYIYIYMYIYMWKNISPRQENGQMCHPHFSRLLRPILTRSTQIEGAFGLFERCCVHIRGLKVARMNTNTFFGHPKLRHPDLPETHIWHPTPYACTCRNTPQKCYISCITCAYVLFDTLSYSKWGNQVSEVPYGSWVQAFIAQDTALTVIKHENK